MHDFLLNLLVFAVGFMIGFFAGGIVAAFQIDEGSFDFDEDEDW